MSHEYKYGALKYTLSNISLDGKNIKLFTVTNFLQSNVHMSFTNWVGYMEEIIMFLVPFREGMFVSRQLRIVYRCWK